MSLASTLSQPFRRELPVLPAMNALTSSAHKILSRWPDVVAEPPEADRERLVRDMLDRVQRDRWEDTRMSLVSSAARAAFDIDRRDRPDLSDLREFYYREIRASSRSTFLGAMTSIYIGSYTPGAAHTRALATALTEAKDRIGARWRVLLERFPQLLDPVEAPIAVASAMQVMQDPWNELKAIGLRSPHGSGLMDHANLAYVKLLQPALHEREQLERLFAWLKPEGFSARAAGASEAIEAILQHWLNDQPPAGLLTFLTQSLVAFYGDPRVQRGGAWAGVRDDQLAIFMRWLTGENIRFFLDVVSAVEDSHMWEPRRRFWLGLHEQGRIDAAWVAFSDSAAKYARRIVSANGGQNTLSFGHQTAGGTRNSTSLLVLKIGRKIVVEGSHNYKIHVFRDTNTKAPKLYQRNYDCEIIRLTTGAEAKSHLGNWQGWVHERI